MSCRLILLCCGCRCMFAAKVYHVGCVQDIIGAMTEDEKADLTTFTAPGRRRVAEATQCSVAQVAAGLHLSRPMTRILTCCILLRAMPVTAVMRPSTPEMQVNCIMTRGTTDRLSMTVAEHEEAMIMRAPIFHRWTIAWPSTCG